MRRQIPGLHSIGDRAEDGLNGVFLARVVRGRYRRDLSKPLVELRFAILEPEQLQDRSFSSRLYCTERALWKLHWFLRDFGYDLDLLHRDQIDDRALLGLRGVVRTSHTILNGYSYQNLDSFAPAGEWETLSSESMQNPPAKEPGRDADGL